MQFFAFTLVALAATSSLAAEPATLALDSAALRLIDGACIRCHGPERARGGLRLDSLDSVLLGGDSGAAAIVPGDPAASPMIQRLRHGDPEERMPQKAPAFSAADIAVVSRWISDGAPWDATVISKPGDVHWSFVAPQRSALPQVDDDGWIRNPIDAFILRGMKEAGLAPSPEAPPHTLLRRVHLDLVGLPPTVDDVREFEASHSERAYLRVVDSLLKSSGYGERQARHWLDAARYADTNGYEKDRARSIWPYRDWVIEAFNRDMPFDRFTIEQIAGDMLPRATHSQKVASGFHRNTMLNEEGGIDAAEDHHKRIVDRVNTTATVFLGLTMACAQCHSHKFDPISQREYYQFAAFFNGADEINLTLPDVAVTGRRDSARREMDDLEEAAVKSASKDEAALREFESWKAEVRARSVGWDVVSPEEMRSKNRATLIVLDDGSVLATGDIPNNDVYEFEFEMPIEAITAIRLEVLPDESLPGGGPGRGTILAEGDFLLTGFEIESIGVDGAIRSVSIRDASEDFAAENSGAAMALDGRSDTGWSVKGALAKPHAAVYEFMQAIAPGEASRVRVRIRQNYIHQHTIGRFRISVTPAPAPVVASGVPSEIESALLGDRSPRRIQGYYFSQVSPRLDEARARLAKMNDALPQLDTTLAFRERAQPRPTYIYHRGEFLQPRDVVSPGVPSVLHDYPVGLARNRLGLARWLVSRENPLLARVTMNRLWRQLFGRGLVTTPEDFGTRGAAPSHPELLDWLAIEFMDRGWSLKEMTRLIVSSATYRQSSVTASEHLRVDPNNVWLARSPRVRVDAEVLRDFALAVGGLLDTTLGGPSVYPPQPAGVTELAYGTASWPVGSGSDRHRRGLYTYWKRTAPYAAAVLFDAPTGEEACVARRHTNTPLQALTLMNDAVFVEAAQSLARRVLDEAHEGDRVNRLFQLCLARDPDPFEGEAMTRFVESTLRELGDNAGEISELSGLNSANPFQPSPSAELAAWTLACRVVLNLDETITRE